ncbi:GNAT family N-acetyltransferase [Tsukamurella spumae]|uniref:GNAT family N-acetyltransferase n=2 Tax=Tsukamurella spumae TaxID=44753 RepID=A0A846X2D4_9ACTN|nr:GNAT family N-acetyltransferase [Tsukamurella spumae]
MVRTLRERFRAGDIVVVVESADGEPVAVAHLSFELDAEVRSAHLNVIAVRVEDRQAGGSRIADEVIERVRAECRRPERSVEAITAVIHVNNRASIRMAQRNGFEPLGAVRGSYQTWVLDLQG